MNHEISLVEFIGYLYEREYGVKPSAFQLEMIRHIEAGGTFEFRWPTRGEQMRSLLRMREKLAEQFLGTGDPGKGP